MPPPTWTVHSKCSAVLTEHFFQKIIGSRVAASRRGEARQKPLLPGYELVLWAHFLEQSCRRSY